MDLLQVEAEEPPSRPKATSQLLTKPHRQIKALSPTGSLVQGPQLVSFAARAERFPTGPVTRAFRKRYFPEVELTQWNDWRWQARSRVRTLAELERIFVLSDDERDAVIRHEGSLPLGITPYYASLMAREDPFEALRRTHVPVGTEYLKTPGEADDPLGEDGHSVVPGLVHRYPDRVLFLATGFCSTYCRYCTRSRMVGEAGGDYTFSRPQWEEALNYIAAHPEVRDVLISGGDPLTLSDERIDYLLGRLRAIKHVEFVRLGTKVPVVLPMRVTRALIRVLKKHHPLWMSVHFTHPAELTPEVTEACTRLADAGIPLGRSAYAPRQAVLPLSMRSDLGLVAFPHERRQGPRDHAGPAWPYHRLCRADLRGRRARRRRQDPAASRLCRRTRRGRSHPQELRGRDLPLYRS
jgi:lysine 2,3-aminomutase